MVKKKVNRMISWFGYVLVAIASNGIFGIYLPNNNPGTPLIAWIVLALIGIGILGLKTLRFRSDERGKVIFADFIYLFIIVGFGFIQFPWGLNIIIGSILAVLYLYFFIDRKYLVHLK